MSITLPFWLEVFSEIKVSPRYVITKRHPASIGRSLSTRDFFDHEYSAQLIYLYWASIVHNLPCDVPRIKVDYELVSQDEVLQRQRLCEFLNLHAVGQPEYLNFDASLERSNFDKTNVGFVWQQDFFTNFPDEVVSLERICELRGYYTALSRAYLPAHLQKVSVNEIFKVADILKHRNVVLYGASQLAALVSGVLHERITLAVDLKATLSKPLKRYGFTFMPLDALVDNDHDCVLVAVTGRKEAVLEALSDWTTRPIYFLEDWLFEV
jgi:hypothetical protein